MKWIMKLQPLLAVFVLTVFAGILATTHSQAASSEKAQTIIQSVQVTGDDASAELVITTSAPVTYTSYKTAAPARMVVDFSQAIPADNLADQVPGRAAFKGVSIKRYDTDAGSLTRMEIELVHDGEPVVAPSADKPNTLRITFPGFKPVALAAAVEAKPTTIEPQVPSQPVVEPAAQTAAAKPDASSPVTETTPTVTAIVSRAEAIQIQVTGTVTEFKTFRLNKPERVVIDIPGVKSAADLKIVSLNAAGISTARVGSYADKVRIVLDAANGGLPDATLAKNDDGILVSFPAVSTQTAAAVQPSEAKPQAEVKQEPKVQPQAAAPVQVAASTKKAKSEPAPAAAALRTQVEAIDFQALEGMSRVSVKVRGDLATEPPAKKAGFVSFKILNAQLPKNLQRSFEAREFKSPVLRITPIQVRSKKGEDTIIRVAMRAEADYSLRTEADMVYLEFKYDETPVAKASGDATTAQSTKASAQAAVEQQLMQTPSADGRRVYTGRKVTLEFADAEVRKIFQLLSEVSNKNFVLGDEVAGTISLKLVNVPWDQALDIILDTKGLDKREEGNIVLIRGKGKFKSLLDEEAEIRKATLKSEPLETAMFDVNYADLATITGQFAALKTDRGMITQDARTNKVIVKDVKTAINDMRALLKSLDVPERQVMIEARIVEATTSFTRSLGVNWGIHYRDGTASIAGINTFDTSFGGLASNVAPSTGVGGQPGAAAGISFGTLGSNIKLDMRLNAAVSAGLVRIVSTPRVATLNHKSAKITQGQQIPYTSSTSDKVETKFVEAALALEVTPHINPNGTIVLKIDAKNDSPGSGGSPPPINKKQATTEMMLRDGETTVIGGIYVERDTNSDEGVPFLKDVPFLGGLFKSDSVEKTRTELLIFITPRILTGSV